MTSPVLPSAPRARLRWAVREGLVIAGILGFWLGVAVVLTGAHSRLGVALHALDIAPFHPVADLLRRTAFLRPALSAVAFATVGRYAVGRAETALIDHHAGA